MTASLPNLARRPFVNARPVARVALLLTAAGVLLLVLNLVLYVGYARTRRANATHLVQVEERIAAEAARVEAASSALTEADLERQNDLVDYLNQRIEERTFSWSVLFDRLATLLPGKVRLNSLTPRFVSQDDDDARRRRGPAPPRRVTLAMQGTARDGEAILELVDALFADPAFDGPDLNQEARQRGEVAFTLSVTYLPEVAEATREGAVESADGDGSGAGDGAATPTVAPADDDGGAT
jgi:Tfp pilus assembly protein PilN